MKKIIFTTILLMTILLFAVTFTNWFFISHLRYNKYKSVILDNQSINIYVSVLCTFKYNICYYGEVGFIKIS